MLNWTWSRNFNLTFDLWLSPSRCRDDRSVVAIQSDVWFGIRIQDQDHTSDQSRPQSDPGPDRVIIKHRFLKPSRKIPWKIPGIFLLLRGKVKGHLSPALRIYSDRRFQKPRVSELSSWWRISVWRRQRLTPDLWTTTELCIVINIKINNEIIHFRTDENTSC